MSGKNWQLVANEPVEFENNRSKFFETWGELPIILEVLLNPLCWNHWIVTPKHEITWNKPKIVLIKLIWDPTWYAHHLLSFCWRQNWDSTLGTHVACVGVGPMSIPMLPRGTNYKWPSTNINTPTLKSSTIQALCKSCKSRSTTTLSRQHGHASCRVRLVYFFSAQWLRVVCCALMYLMFDIPIIVSKETLKISSIIISWEFIVILQMEVVCAHPCQLTSMEWPKSDSDKFGRSCIYETKCQQKWHPSASSFKSAPIGDPFAI